MDAITYLKQDHKVVKTKGQLVERMITELSVHAAIEEAVFYPSTREARQETEDQVLESLEEHHVVKVVLAELDGMDPHDERFDAKVTVMMEMVRHHVEEEEQELFPMVRAAMGRKDLEEIGRRLDEARKTAPTRPHPHAPDQPPGNVIASAAAAVVDAGRDAARRARRSA
jgi:hemerythrin superfamily protein